MWICFIVFTLHSNIHYICLNLTFSVLKKMNFRPLLLLFIRSVMSSSLSPHGLQHARHSCPSPSPGLYSNSWALSRWCHPVILSSVIPFSCLQSFPESGFFPMSRLFTWCGQSIGASASASVLPMNSQSWLPLGWTGLISQTIWSAVNLKYFF